MVRLIINVFLYSCFLEAQSNISNTAQHFFSSNVQICLIIKICLTSGIIVVHSMYLDPAAFSALE